MTTKVRESASFRYLADAVFSTFTFGLNSRFQSHPTAPPLARVPDSDRSPAYALRGRLWLTTE